MTIKWHLTSVLLLKCLFVKCKPLQTANLRWQFGLSESQTTNVLWKASIAEVLTLTLGAGMIAELSVSFLRQPP